MVPANCSNNKAAIYNLHISHNAPSLEVNRQVLLLFRLCSHRVEVPRYWPLIKMHYGICANGLSRRYSGSYMPEKCYHSAEYLQSTTKAQFCIVTSTGSSHMVTLKLGHLHIQIPQTSYVGLIWRSTAVDTAVGVLLMVLSGYATVTTM